VHDPRSIRFWNAALARAATLAAVLAAAACGGGANVTSPPGTLPSTRPSVSPSAPSASPAASTAPGSTSGLFAGSVPSVSGSVSGPVSLATPSSGAYTLAGLATQLDALNPPAAGAPVGTIGIVTSTSAKFIVVRQVPLISPNDSSGTPLPFVSNIASAAPPEHL